MIQKRETEEDRLKQRRLLEVFSRKIGYSFTQFSSFSKKYRIDGCCYDADTRLVACWVECKWYNKIAHCYLNVPKFTELVTLSESTNKPSYLLFREGNRWGYILIHDGLKTVCNYTTQVKGGTPSDRVANDDDIEPLIVLDKSFIVWGN